MLKVKEIKSDKVTNKQKDLEDRGYTKQDTQWENPDIYSKIDCDKWLDKINEENDNDKTTERVIIHYSDTEYDWNYYELWTRPKKTKEELHRELTKQCDNMRKLARVYAESILKKQHGHPFADYKEIEQLTEEIYNDVKEGLF